MASRQLFALSNSKMDSDLIGTGLKNIGLVGFLDKNASKDTSELHSYYLKFPKGPAYFYTLDPTKERFDNRDEKKMPSLGYARKNAADDFRLLHRIFLTDQQCHVYVTRTENIGLLGPSRDESGDNPIYIKTEANNNEVPLYIYSNVLDFDQFYNPIENVDVWESKQDLISEFKSAIRTHDLEEDKFHFITDSTSVTVLPTIQKQFENFYVNHPEGTTLFFVRQNPLDDDGAAFYTDADQSSVLSRFEGWIEKVKGLKSNPILDGDPDTGDVDASSNYRIQNLRISPAIGVTSQAKIFLNLLDSIPSSESGLLLGIFGRWGRGKTFFWIQLKELFAQRVSDGSRKKNERQVQGKRFLGDRIQNIFRSKTEANSPHAPDVETIKSERQYLPVEFHAWKYQDTPASWAYLYEVLEKEFCEGPIKGIRNSLTRVVNRFRLNLERQGWWKLSVGLAVMTYGVFWYFFLDFNARWDLVSRVISFIGIGTLVSVVLYYCLYSGTARNLIKQYFSKVSYHDLLGVQAEIQKELRHLFGVWVPDPSTHTSRIVLFVDDIDRCSEDRIIQVIDSLKVMMDDPFISQRAVVIAAVDETVLKRAIKRKYIKMITSDSSLNKEQKRITLDQLCREYMDKLFLNGFKLGNLSSDEKIEIVKSITENRVNFYNGDKEETKENTEGTSANGSLSPGQAVQSTGDNTDVNGSGTTPATNPNDSAQAIGNAKATLSQVKKEFEITEREFQNIIKAITHFEDATPRAIRIFYYRYLLARQIKASFILNNVALSREWLSLKQKEILCYLILEYSANKTQTDLISEIKSSSNSPAEQVTKTILDSQFTLSPKLYAGLLRIVAIVVPY